MASNLKMSLHCFTSYAHMALSKKLYALFKPVLWLILLLRFHALSLGQVDQPPGVSLLRLAGNQWAKKAESLLLNNYGKVSVQRLMVRDSSLIDTHPFTVNRQQYCYTIFASE